MVQTLEHLSFDIVVNRPKDQLTYIYYDNATGKIYTNGSDIKHGKNLDLSGLEHKVLHEIAHHYTAIELRYNFCPIAYAQAHNKTMPDNVNYLEEIVFSMVYLCREKKMLYDTWFSYLDRLYTKTDVFELKYLILDRFRQFQSGKQKILL